jgi:predicted ArsR family transcriptional regulator
MSKLPLIDRCFAALVAGPATAVELARTVGVTPHTAYLAIAALKGMGKIQPGATMPRTTRYGRPSRQWRVA